VSSGSRYQREHGEELTVNYRLGPIEEAMATLGGCAWRCALRREKRVSVVAADAEEMAAQRAAVGNVGAYQWRQRRRRVK
jgi:hypothetical protein